MTRAQMRTVLFLLFVGVIVVTVYLASVATLTAVGAQAGADELWKFVYFTWSGLLLEIVGLMIALGRNLFGLRGYDLAREIANKWAQDVVEEAIEDPDPIAAMDTGFTVTLEDLERQFRSQGKEWAQALVAHFREEALLQAHRTERLRSWSIAEGERDLAPQDVAG